jgi:hypothetical protein
VNLDTQGGGYAVFATITSGTAVVEAMRAAACIETLFLFAGECLPSPNLVITMARQTR